MSSKISVTDLYKVFGPEPERALELLSQGYSKKRLLEESSHIVGVRGVSFAADAGEIFVVMGLSGSGKSTLVRMLNRLIDPTAGQIHIDGEDLVGADEAQLRRIRLEKIAMVFQHFALFPHKSVAENVAYGLKVRGVARGERGERARAALEQVGLKAWADSATRALSGGMQQRVGLARALAVDPEILLMDEPFSALDPLIRRDMQQELIALQNKLRKTIIFITHDLHEALILGDHIAIMNEGRFVQVGTAKEIVGSPADDYVSAFTQDVDRARVFTSENVMAEAHALDLTRDTPETARRRMEELGRTALHVAAEGKPLGIVTYRDLVESPGGNGNDLAALMCSDFPSTTRDVHLHRLYALCAGGLPVAVLDEAGRIEGVAEPQAVFAQIAPEERAGGTQE